MPNPAPAPESNAPKAWLFLLALALLLAYGVGLFGRNLWTPDEPREADIAWRMSWQNQLAVPNLAGEAFCEKPPLGYWIAAASIRSFGSAPWAMRLPNLFYALLSAWALAAIARRWLDRNAAVVAAVAGATFLLCYQTAIWFATDAPLMAAVAVSLLGLSRGFYARDRRERLSGYWLMHAALAAGFLCKSLAAWIVPVLCLIALALWEKRARELLRWELLSGVLLQAAIIAPWIWFVYIGPHGLENLKVFFWNNLVGRFTAVDAPAQLQYASSHRNSPGKYLYELPLYLWPWTLIAIAALRRAWRERASVLPGTQVMRIGVCAFFPALAALSVAATARNIYLAPPVLSLSLVLAWWAQRFGAGRDHFEVRMLKATAAMLLIAAALAIPILVVIGMDARAANSLSPLFVPICAAGLAVGVILALKAWRAATADSVYKVLGALALSYCALVIGPVSQADARVNAWQDLASVARAVAGDSAGGSLILYAPDETTLAIIDLYGRRPVSSILMPIESERIAALQAKLAQDPSARVLIMRPGRTATPTFAALAARLKQSKYGGTAESMPAWIAAQGLEVIKVYEIPNGRRYALIAKQAPR